MELALVLLGFLGLVALIMAIQYAEQTAHSRKLSAFLRSLPDGRGRTELGFLDSLTDAWVRGRLEGAPISLTFETRGSGKHKHDVAVYQVEVDNPAAGFTVSKAGLLDRLGQWIGLSKRTDLHPDLDDDLVLRAGSAAAVKGLFQQEALAGAVRRLTHELGFDEVQLSSSTLRVEARVRGDTLDAPALRRVFDTLIGVARQCERRRVSIKLSGKVSVTPRFAWTGGEQAARCPYCREEVALDRSTDDLTACEQCGTLHHAACMAEAGGCTIFGCGARRGRSRDRA